MWVSIGGLGSNPTRLRGCIFVLFGSRFLQHVLGWVRVGIFRLHNFTSGSESEHDKENSLALFALVALRKAASGLDGGDGNGACRFRGSLRRGAGRGGC